MPRNNCAQKKCDFTSYFHQNTLDVSALYRALSYADVGDVLGQTMDASTKRPALFSGIEVKQGNGGKDEALAQLAIWCAAGMQNTEISGLGLLVSLIRTVICPQWLVGLLLDIIGIRLLHSVSQIMALTGFTF